MTHPNETILWILGVFKFNESVHLKLINYWFKKCKIDEIIKTNPNKTISPTLTVAAAHHTPFSGKVLQRHLPAGTQNVLPSVGFQEQKWIAH